MLLFALPGADGILIALAGVCMNREQVRFIIALVVVVSLAVVGYYVATSLRAQERQEQDLTKWAKDIVPEVAQRMQNFRRAKIRDGKKVWEIAAQQARYLQDNNEVVVERPEVSLYLKDGEIIALRCQEGRVYLDGDEDVTRMELSGDLEIRVNDLVITTPNAVYNSEQNTIVSSGPIHIAGRGLEVEGQGYTVNVSEKRLTLNADVRTTMTKGEG
jgi:LPS export ABC transporter protein LptC